MKEIINLSSLNQSLFFVSQKIVVCLLVVVVGFCFFFL